nr:phage terminase large subunit [Rhodovibrio salinarum]
MDRRAGARVPGFGEFVWVWDRQQGLRTAAVHLRIARWLEACWQRGETRLLLQAFRSAGKSSLVGLFCAWLLGRMPDLRILVLAAEQALAVKMVRNVRGIVERHPFLAGLRPQRAQEWAADRFTVERPGVLRDPSMLARGVTANVTGSRADVVICDDVEVPNTCDTPDKRAELRRRLGEIDYLLVPGGLQLYVGTPHTYFTIYAEGPREEVGETRAFLDGFARLTVPIQDAQGTPAWPERFSKEAIRELAQRSGPNSFASQMLLQPVNVAEGRLDPARLRRYSAELDYAEGNDEAVLTLMGDRLVAAACWWDPAYGAPGRGDASVIAAVFLDAAGNAFLHRVAYLTHDPATAGELDEATQLCRQATAFARDLYLPSISLEVNGVGRFLPGLLRRELAAAGVPAAVREVTSRRPKDLRILEAFDAPLAAGALHAHDSVFATSFVQEMRDWRPGLTHARDDGLDAVAGCLASEPVRLPRLPSAGRHTWRPGMAGVHAPADFDV